MPFCEASVKALAEETLKAGIWMSVKGPGLPLHDTLIRCHLERRGSPLRYAEQDTWTEAWWGFLPPQSAIEGCPSQLFP